MRLAVLGHSNIHVRQVNFYREVAALGHEVLILSPGEWREQRAKSTEWIDYGLGKYRIHTLRHFGGEDVYRFVFLGLEEVLASFKPDVLYVQQEPASVAAQEAALVEVKLAPKVVLFTWENQASGYTPFAKTVLEKYDLVVCGNDEAQSLVQQFNKNTVILPQVGVDTAHFQERQVVRNISVAYIGRLLPEKGVEKLQLAWPTARVLPWMPYTQLPWWYSQCQVVVCYSQDTQVWREQAMPFVSVEATCCGALAIVSDAGSIPFWHTKFAGINPGSVLVPQDNVLELKKQIQYALECENRKQLAQEGREWVEANLSSKVIAQRLVEVLG